METKLDHLFNAVMSLAMGDIENSKAAYDQYWGMLADSQVNGDGVNEDHDRLLSEEGIDDFLKTLHRRATKAGKGKEFCEELSKFAKVEVMSPKDFNKTADHFSKDKKRADQFIHAVEKKLGLGKDDPAKDIKGEGEDE